MSFRASERILSNTFLSDNVNTSPAAVLSLAVIRRTERKDQ